MVRLVASRSRQGGRSPDRDGVDARRDRAGRPVHGAPGVRRRDGPGVGGAGRGVRQRAGAGDAGRAGGRPGHERPRDGAGDGGGCDARGSPPVQQRPRSNPGGSSMSRGDDGPAVTRARAGAARRG